MKIINLFRIESKTFKSNLKISELEAELINGFDLNRKKSFKSFFQKENTLYKGTLKNNKFNITKNANISEYDSNYFFHTQIKGEIFDHGYERIIKVNADFSDGTQGFFLGSSPIYLLILIFGNFWMGIFCFLMLIFVYLYGKKEIKYDFEIFENHFRQNITVYEID